MLLLEGVTAGYGNNEVLNDLSLTVNDGEIVALLGLNGAGKTTTVRTIGGLIKVRHGRLVYNGIDIANSTPRERVLRGISVVPEGRSLFFSMTVDENLDMGAFTRSDRSEIRKDKLSWFEYFPNLARLRRRYSGQLSGGEQGLASFARGMMSQPSLMVLDEPSLGIAPKVLEEIGATVKRMRDERGLSCLLVEQDVPFALSVADRVLVMVSGRIVAEMTPEELRDGERLREIFLGATPTN
jgi:branched-chain amino acid transport system ATP-binding protein